jgi:hypothetical protein
MIKAEAARQQDVARRRAQLLDEMRDPAIVAVLAHRTAEEKLRKIQDELAVLANSNSATHADWQRRLETSMPDDLRTVLQQARRELSARRNADSQDAAGLRQLAALREWHDQVERALPDPDVTSAQLAKLAEAGRGLLSAEGTVARV